MPHLNQLLRSLEIESRQLYDAVSTPSKNDSIYSDPAKITIMTMRLDKVMANMDHTRSVILDLESDQQAKHNHSEIQGYRNSLKTSNEYVQDVQQILRLRKVEANAMHKSTSTDGTATSETKPESSQVRQRKNVASANPAKVTLSRKYDLSEKLASHQDTQDSLLHDISGFIANIKKNATLLGDKMSQDQDIVESAASALNKSSDTMAKTGGRLTKYRSDTAIGFWFYIYAAIFIAVAAIVGAVIVKI